jgi:hypothetical protein
MPNNARIYYDAADQNRPAGGEKHAYEHVDLLNASGFEAYIVHSHPSHRHTWFANTTAVIDYQSLWRMYDISRDYIVLSEFIGDDVMKFPGKKVIFNRNLYLGFKAFHRHRASREYPYIDQSVSAIFAVSAHNLSHLKFAFPQASIYRMYCKIDADLFKFRHPAQKRRRIACVAKAMEPLMVLYHMLLARSHAGLNKLSEYEWTFLEGLSERETAQVLNESLVLVALNTHEGLPRTVLEALACGCLVMAYGSGPLRECLPPAYQFQTDDLISIAERIERVTNGFPANADVLGSGSEAARGIALQFSAARQRSHLVAAWEDVVGGVVASCPDEVLLGKD